MSSLSPIRTYRLQTGNLNAVPLHPSWITPNRVHGNMNSEVVGAIVSDVFAIFQFLATFPRLFRAHFCLLYHMIAKYHKTTSGLPNITKNNLQVAKYHHLNFVKYQQNHRKIAKYHQDEHRISPPSWAPKAQSVRSVPVRRATRPSRPNA